MVRPTTRFSSVASPDFCLTVLDAKFGMYANDFEIRVRFLMDIGSKYVE